MLAGMPYIVGERRPELFIPNTNGYISPSVPRGGGGMGSPTVIVNVYGSVQTEQDLHRNIYN